MEIILALVLCLPALLALSFVKGPLRNAFLLFFGFLLIVHTIGFLFYQNTSLSFLERFIPELLFVGGLSILAIFMGLFEDVKSSTAESHDYRLLFRISLVLNVAVGLFFFGGLPEIPLIMLEGMLTGQSYAFAGDISNARYEITKAAYFGGENSGRGIFKVFITNGFLCSGFFTSQIDDKGWSRRLRFAFLLFWAFILLTADGTRSGFLLFLLSLGFFKFLRHSTDVALNTTDAAIKGTSAALSGLPLAFVAAVIITAANNKGAAIFAESGIFSVFDKVVERIFFGNAQNDVFVLELVKDKILALGWGSGLWNEIKLAIPGISGQSFYYVLFEMIGNEKSFYVSGSRNIGSTYLTGTIGGRALLDFGPNFVFLYSFLIIGTFWLALRLTTILKIDKYASSQVIFLFGTMPLGSITSFLINILFVATLVIIYRQIATLIAGHAQQRDIPARPQPSTQDDR